jgi:hypothetical protein
VTRAAESYRRFLLKKTIVWSCYDFRGYAPSPIVCCTGFLSLSEFSMGITGRWPSGGVEFVESTVQYSTMLGLGPCNNPSEISESLGWRGRRERSEGLPTPGTPRTHRVAVVGSHSAGGKNLSEIRRARGERAHR